VNTYEAGFAGGQFLGRWALEHWGGEIEEIVLMDMRRASTVVRYRVTAALDGIVKILGERRSARAKTVWLDGDGDFEKSWRLARAHLLSTKAKKTLLSGVNDTTVLGALRAYEETGRAPECAAVGQNCSAEARRELRHPGSPFIGSVAYFPEKYGEGLLKIALQMFKGQFVPPAIFVVHQLLTPKNVDTVYPFDDRSQPRCGELPSGQGLGARPQMM
jgi:ribose transport system substrate-binding protein